jgi:hypothetical protein
VLLVWMTRLWPSLLGVDAGGSAGDHPSLAPRGLQGALALEVAKEGQQEAVGLFFLAAIALTVPVVCKRSYLCFDHPLAL